MSASGQCTGATLRTEILPWRDSVPALRGQWTALLDADDVDLSMHPSWLEAVAGAWGCLDELHVCAVYDGTDLRFVLPYRVVRRTMYGIPVRVLEPASSLASYHVQMLADAPRELPRLLAVALAVVPQCWDVLHFGALLVDTPTTAGLRALARERGWRLLSEPGERSPYLRLEGDWASVLGAKSQKTRYTLRRKERRLHAAGRFEEHWYTHAEQTEDLLRAMLHVEERSWKVHAGMAISRRPQEIRYYERLLPLLARLDALRANTLILDGAPIAYSLCYRWRARWAQMKTSFDDAFRQLSPGSVVNLYAIRRACEEGDREFDFLGDVMPHKQEWTDDLRAHEDVYVYSNHARARALGLAKALRHWVRTSAGHDGGPRSPDMEERSS